MDVPLVSHATGEPVSLKSFAEAAGDEPLVVMAGSAS